MFVFILIFIAHSALLFVSYLNGAFLKKGLCILSHFIFCLLVCALVGDLETISVRVILFSATSFLLTS